MLGRFFQLFLLASLVLLLPSLFYLSQQQHPYSIARDYALMQTGQQQPQQQQPGYGNGLGRNAPAGQVAPPAHEGSQGQGPPPALDPEIAQSWKWANLHWPGRGKGGKVGQSPASPPAAAPAGARVDGVIMPKMENVTAKAELGRATWRFLHTMTLRFPDEPTLAESETLVRFFHDFASLYPCGECAKHFQELLRDLPPQASSRMASALWLCSAHNLVNARLGKPEFPCDKLDETYDCGCGPESNKTTAGAAEKAAALAGKATAPAASA